MKKQKNTNYIRMSNKDFYKKYYNREQTSSQIYYYINSELTESEAKKIKHSSLKGEYMAAGGLTPQNIKYIEMETNKKEIEFEPYVYGKNFSIEGNFKFNEENPKGKNCFKFAFSYFEDKYIKIGNCFKCHAITNENNVKWLSEFFKEQKYEKVDAWTRLHQYNFTKSGEDYIFCFAIDANKLQDLDQVVEEFIKKSECPDIYVEDMKKLFEKFDVELKCFNKFLRNRSKVKNRKERLDFYDKYTESDKSKRFGALGTDIIIDDKKPEKPKR